MKKIIIKNAVIVTPEEELTDCFMLVEGEKIAGIFREDSVEGQKHMRELIKGETEVLDAYGAYLLPGMIDIHSDMIESLIQPRATSVMKYGDALNIAERQLAGCGITTMFHSISMYREGSWDGKEIRRTENVVRLAEMVKEKAQKEHLIHNRYHLRYELDNVEGYNVVKELIDRGCVQLLSFMDHRPGQGQYRDLSIYRRHLPQEGRNMTDEEFEMLVEREWKKPMIQGERLLALAAYAKEKGIPMSSHDDESVEKLEMNEKLKVSVSEFPITMEVARAAREKGFYVLFGAPNVIRGGSHAGNMSAEEAVRENCADILCSDYYPPAMLQAVFYLRNKGALSLPAACNMVSLNPARAVGIAEETGSLTPGKLADFLLVREENGEQILCQTWVAGRPAMQLAYRKGLIGA